MTDDRYTRAKEIFSTLLDAEPENPGAWLDERCGEDRPLRLEVESLLEAYEHGPLSDDDVEAVA